MKREKDTMCRTAAISDAAIPEGQAWLEDLHAQGWALDGVGKYLAYFKRCTPEKQRYRIEYRREKGYMPEDQRQLYEDCGWEIVDDNDSLRRTILRAPADADMPELHTDPEEQLHFLRRRLRAWCGGMVLCFAMFVAMLVLRWRLDGGIWKGFYQDPLRCGPLVYVPLIVLGTAVNCVRIRRRIRTIRESGSVPQRADWRRGRFCRAAAIWGMLIACFWPLMCSLTDISRPISSTPLALSDAPMQPFGFYDLGMTDTPQEKSISYRDYPFGTKYFYFDEMNTEAWATYLGRLYHDENASDTLEGFLAGEDTELRWNWLAAGVAKDQARACRRYGLEPVTAAGTDAAWQGTDEDGGRRMYLARRGRFVSWVEIYGVGEDADEAVWRILCERLARAA